MKEILKKILAVQESLESVSKSKTNPHFKSRYFDINLLIAELKPILNKAKLVVVQPLVTVDGKQCIRTVVADPESGELVESTFALPDGLDAQKLGGAITFFRRYALTSFFLVEGEADDDGNAASGKVGEKKSVTSDEFNLG